MSLDMMKALMGRDSMEVESDMEDMPEGEMDDDTDTNVDPRSMSADGKTLFIDKTLFPEGCKVGDEVSIVATVTKHGEKYGVTVGEIAKKGNMDSAI